MAPQVIVSYDGTENDQDALALARQLHDLGAALTLAYVRHSVEASPEREQVADREARALLERGASQIDDSSIERRVVISASTGEGLGRLAVELGADVIVFGSEYRTAPGHVTIARSAQTLLESGPAAVALAPAGYAAHTQVRELNRIGVLPGTADEAAIETAFSLAGRHGAAVADSAHGIELLVVGSRREAPEGRVMITASATHAIEEATVPVLVVARGTTVSFETLVTV